MSAKSPDMRRQRRKALTPNPLILDEYATFAQLAAMLGKSERWVQRQAAMRLLSGLVYLGRTPMVHLPTYRAGLEARVIKAVQPRTRRRRP